MSDSESDGYGAFDFSEFTSEDLAKIDAHVERSLATNSTKNHPILLPTPDDHTADESYDFDTDIVVNLSELTEEEFSRIDRAVAEAMSPKSRGQALASEDIEEVVNILSRDLGTVLEGEAGPSTVQSRTKATKTRVQTTWSGGYSNYAWKGKKKNPSLMDIFRRKKILSVSDLVGPAWYVYSSEWLHERMNEAGAAGVRSSMTMACARSVPGLSRIGQHRSRPVKAKRLPLRSRLLPRTT
jgi:exonuclease V